MHRLASILDGQGCALICFSSLRAWGLSQEPPCWGTNAQIMSVPLSDVDFRAQSELVGLHDQRSGTTQNALECPQLLLSSSAGPRPENRKNRRLRVHRVNCHGLGQFMKIRKPLCCQMQEEICASCAVLCACTRGVLATLMLMDSNMTLAAKLPGCIRESKLACPRSTKGSFL